MTGSEGNRARSWRARIEAVDGAGHGDVGWNGGEVDLPTRLNIGQRFVPPLDDGEAGVPGVGDQEADQGLILDDEDPRRRVGNKSRHGFHWSNPSDAKDLPQPGGSPGRWI